MTCVGDEGDIDDRDMGLTGLTRRDARASRNINLNRVHLRIFIEYFDTNFSAKVQRAITVQKHWCLFGNPLSQDFLVLSKYISKYIKKLHYYQVIDSNHHFVKTKVLQQLKKRLLGILCRSFGLWGQGLGFAINFEINFGV